VGELQSLQHLQLDFNQCTSLTNLVALGEGIGELQGLQHLQLDFGQCTALTETDFAALGRGVQKLQGIPHLQFDRSQSTERQQTLTSIKDSLVSRQETKTLLGVSTHSVF
jgi:hypothetical protein